MLRSLEEGGKEMEFPLYSFKQRATCIALLVSCTLLITTSGCQGLRERTDALANSTRSVLTWQKFKKGKESEQPARMVAIWSESTIMGPNQVPIRGLGGRIYLYNGKHQAIKGEGDLVVFAYNDETSNEENVEPDRKYVIPAEDLAKHYSPSEFGPSYSIWIPWDAVSDDALALSVVPIFKSQAGQTLVGDHSRNLLPGKGEPAGVLARQVHRYEQMTAVQPASFQKSDQPSAIENEAHRDGESAASQIQASTIPLPPTTRQRLLQSLGNAESARPGQMNDPQSLSRARHDDARIDDPQLVARLLQQMDQQSSGSRTQPIATTIADQSHVMQTSAVSDPMATQDRPSRNRPAIHRERLQRPAPASRVVRRADDRTATPHGHGESPFLPPFEYPALPNGRSGPY
jgi:hypothetical protein